MSDDTTKTCSKCNVTYPATTEYFYSKKSGKYGLHAECKLCMHKRHREYYQNNQEKILKHNREYQQMNPERKRELDRNYRQANRDKLRKYFHEYDRLNVGKRQEWKKANRDKLREYQQANLDKNRIKTSRYRARKRQLPDTFTEQEWLACLEYFDYSCAVCGTSFEDVSVHADHWIPLSSPDCTGTIATNMVCLCGSCNSSKRNTIPDIWLKERYGANKVDEILQRVELYFKLICR